MDKKRLFSILTVLAVWAFVLSLAVQGRKGAVVPAVLIPACCCWAYLTLNGRAYERKEEERRERDRRMRLRFGRWYRAVAWGPLLVLALGLAALCLYPGRGRIILFSGILVLLLLFLLWLACVDYVDRKSEEKE